MVSIICASSKNGIIGVNNRLPWKLPADLRHFKQLTTGHHVLMGRKTYEAIGKPLAGRTNVIITRQEYLPAPDCVLAHSLKDGLELCKNDQEIFVIGGASIYEQALPLADKIYLTLIDADFTGDTKMFAVNKQIWKEATHEDFQADEKNKYPYSFITYVRYSFPY